MTCFHILNLTLNCIHEVSLDTVQKWKLTSNEDNKIQSAMSVFGLEIVLWHLRIPK